MGGWSGKTLWGDRRQKQICRSLQDLKSKGLKNTLCASFFSPDHFFPGAEGLDVIYSSLESIRNVHPCQRPVELMCLKYKFTEMQKVLLIRNSLAVTEVDYFPQPPLSCQHV